MTMPSLFLSHGSPMLALEDNATTRFFRSLGQELPAPRAIIVFSAHFDIHGSVTITSGETLETIHDFYGFPKDLYNIHYPAKGAPELAQTVGDLLNKAGFTHRMEPNRGLDHGAWVPLKWIYPEADIPVIQVSINSQMDSHYHYRLGKALKSLGEQDVLLIGSGGITHNLRAFFSADSDPSLGEKARVFNDWIAEQLTSHQLDALLDYKQQAPEAAFNHPTAEHLLPLHCVLGTVEKDSPIKRLHQAMDHQILSLDAYRFGE